ncbi:hypothetical protein FRB99_006720 [Tulasnella sp. 403]|nr:hypothetical protein FRB99_006720 [Tulasnella sp. 403]
MATNSKRILFVLTSASTNLLGKPTGYYLPEGPNPPVDPQSVELFKDDEVKFFGDDVVKQKLANAVRVKDVDPNDYDAIFYVGGHGPVIDLATDEDNIKLANAIYRAGKVTAAVCHGPAALIGVTDVNDESIFKGREFTGFSNVEEEQVHQVKAIPFLLEDKIQEKGGKYVKADEPWGPKVVVDGNLITGQNPASANGIGEAILNALA